MELEYTTTEYSYKEVKLSFCNYDKPAISCFLDHIGKEKLSVLLRNAQIEFTPTKLSHFFFKFLNEKCYLYIIVPEGNFKIIEVDPFYIPRKNWQILIAPLKMAAGDFNPILYANDVKKG